MSSSDIQARLGQTLIDFSSNGIFPEEEAVSAATLDDSALPAALVALNDAKAELEV
jgi:protein transport protein DSL1/ZW10